ncbi:cancer-related nucleoside-triphosphatase homolog [Achroia grisella]|uniref:cancer-related nucleoside-triphosphatase homolog n=1 Tax=Achroia grisella TaxID=688607 RepID=UPI0027D2F938|nr:cancer-related nucleoside-triphosphatase homolog [Achroia grisella]
MANNNTKYFILTGEPGVGKTTLVKKLLSIINNKGISTSGFYTEEVRRKTTRVGFDVVTLEGTRCRLAREDCLLDCVVENRVGKYGVLVQEFEAVALPCLQVNTHQLLIIDEIGKMEFFSNSFKNRIREIFSDSSNDVVLATIPLRKIDTLIEKIRNNKNAKVWTVTRDNRNNIDEEIIKEMKLIFRFD